MSFPWNMARRLSHTKRNLLGISHVFGLRSGDDPPSDTAAPEPELTPVWKAEQTSERKSPTGLSSFFSPPFVQFHLVSTTEEAEYDGLCCWDENSAENKGAHRAHTYSYERSDKTPEGREGQYAVTVVMR